MRTSLWPARPTLELADHWQLLQASPSYPPDAQLFDYKFADGAISLVMVNAIPLDRAMALEQQKLINGLRGAPEVTSAHADPIEAPVGRTRSGVPYVYSLMEIPQEPSGIH